MSVHVGPDSSEKWVMCKSCLLFLQGTTLISRTCENLLGWSLAFWLSVTEGDTDLCVGSLFILSIIAWQSDYSHVLDDKEML